MRSALVLILVAVHLSWGAEGFDHIERPHVGTVWDTGSIPVASTTISAPFTLQFLHTHSVHSHGANVDRQRASRTPSAAKSLTVRMAHKYGYRSAQLRCLLNLWQRESNFRPQALNRRSGAGGVPQILGLDPATPTRRQIERGLTYIAHRYGSPCLALRHHDQRGWY